MKTLFFITLISTFISAQTLVLSDQQVQNWRLHVKSPQKIERQFLSEIIGSVEVPTKLIHSISSAYDMKVQRLFVNRYEQIKKGQALALVGGGSWIQMQQNLINRSISLHESTLENERKILLCDEGIIPKKECIRSQSSYESTLAHYQSAKSSLLLFGIDEAFVERIEKSKIIQREFEIRAPISGLLYAMDIQVGQSVEASTVLFTIYAKGDLWLSANIAQNKAEFLHNGSEVILEYRNRDIHSKVVSLAPIVDVQTQTVPVRFLIDNSESLNIGLKATFSLSTKDSVVKIPKSWTVMEGKIVLIFVKRAKGFESKTLVIVSEDSEFYYSSNLSLLNEKIVSSGVAALKGMLGEEDD
jgi:multidrug efflux pump subunit AcrA (membrane-fusion protein)